MCRVCICQKNYFASSIIKSKTVSVFMSLSKPRFSVIFTLTAIWDFSFSIISSEFQKRLTQIHFSKILCSILSFSSLQKVQCLSAATPIPFNTMLAAVILCKMRICIQLSLTSLILRILIKTRIQEATICHAIIICESIVIESCTFLYRVDCFQRNIYIMYLVIVNS